MSVFRRIVIVGCGAAGISAAIAARKTDRTAKITIIECGKHRVYERGGIPFAVAGEVSSFHSLISFSSQYYEMMRIAVCLETKATDIDSSVQEITVVDQNREKRQIKYDSLILATGAFSFIVPVPGYALPEVYGVRTLDDGIKIITDCKTADSAIVVGARLVGLEMAVALKQRGLNVHVIEIQPQILAGILDREFARDIQEKLESLGVHFILGQGITEILGKDHVRAVRAGSTNLPAEMVIMATGVRGRTELAQKIGLKLGSTRLIKVNEHLETSIPTIFAAGDCVECVDAITGLPTVSQLGTTAMTQGKIAGTNAAGGSLKLRGTLHACVTQLQDTQLASTGLTEATAKQLGIPVVSASTHVSARPAYYPEKLLLRVKLVANRQTQKLVGAQIVGTEEAAPRIDMLSMAIQKGATVTDLRFLDHAYSPPVAESTDPVTAVADILSRKLIQIQ